jgi:hypothetical protein
MFGFVKSTQAAGTSVVTLAITVPAVRVGDLVVVTCKFSSAVSAVSVTDNASVPNTYALAAGPISATNNNMYQFYGVAVTGGATTVTINWTGSSSCRHTVDEFSGGMQTNATVFDKVASNTGTGTSSTVTLAPTNANELICAGIGLNGAAAVVKGTNYVIATNSTSTSTEYRQVGTASETAPFSWTNSVAWSEIAGAYIPSPTTGNFMQFL